MTDLRVICLSLATALSALVVAACVFIGLNCVAERDLFPEDDDE